MKMHGVGRIRSSNLPSALTAQLLCCQLWMVLSTFIVLAWLVLDFGLVGQLPYGHSWIVHAALWKTNKPLLESLALRLHNHLPDQRSKALVLASLHASKRYLKELQRDIPANHFICLYFVPISVRLLVARFMQVSLILKQIPLAWASKPRHKNQLTLPDSLRSVGFERQKWQSTPVSWMRSRP